MAIELEVIGRHAMLFDDDATLEFVNSKEALIEWNSLFIDRFDVRNLIISPPTSFRHLPTSFYHSGSSGLVPDDDSDLFPDLDTERFADLLPDNEDHDDVGLVSEKDPTNAGGYNCVPFSYGNADSTDQKDFDMGPSASSFHPSFPVPENILQNLPPTEKVHQIIARTAMFVGEHGGQSEIVLRVKQGDNPTFGFLMPHHHLHPYFRYLVDHPEVLKTDNDSKSQEEKSNGIQASGALSLLGSVYGSGEDEDVAAEVDRSSEQTVSGITSSAVDMVKTDQPEQTLAAGDGAQKDDKVSKCSQLSKVKVSAPSMYSVNNIKPGRVSSIKSDGNISSSIGSSIEKPKTLSLFPLAHAETSVVDPPSEMKRLVDRVVEIILKNGKDFETVLTEQDKMHGKFPFLLPSNKYNPYYVRVLKKAQESRISGKAFGPGKDSSSWQEIDKNAPQTDNEFTSLDGSDDLDLDYDKKDKFKMVIPKSKKDSQDQPSKESHQQCGTTMDATATAAILQAATRGIRNPNLNIFSNKTSHGSNLKGGPSSGPNLTLKENGETSHMVSDDKEKLKAERLRRAKMFAAMIKSGASSLESRGPANSGLAVDKVVEEVKGREGTYPPRELVQNLSNDENEQKLSKMRHYRSRKHEEGQGEDGSEGNEEVSEEEDEEDKRRSRKKHKSRHSSRHSRDRSKDRHKHRRKHSSSKSKESRRTQKYETSDSLEDDDDMPHGVKHDSSSEEEQRYRKRRHIHSSSKNKESHHRHHHESSDSMHEGDNRRRRGKPDSCSEEERKHRKRRHRHDGESSEEESKRHRRRHKQSSRKDRHQERSRKHESHVEEVELEEGEIRLRSSDQSLSAMGGDASREASMDASRSPDKEKRLSLPPTETTEVPDELRAKIRAMLLATM